MITYDDFSKVELKIATILEAEAHPDPKVDKLLVLKLDLGTEQRQIVAGIKKHCTLEELKGKQIVIVANLEPRMVRNVMSHGMLLAVSNDTTFSLLTTDKTITPGVQAK